MVGSPKFPRGRPIADATPLLRDNLAAVRDVINRAAERAGRDADGVRLVAVTKSVDTAITAELTRLGATALGENRIQVATPKIEALGDAAEWHLIGHLQANKGRRAVELFDWIHSIDSVALFERIDRIASELERSPKVLLQVNVSGETTKHGFDEGSLKRFLQERPPRNLMPVGLMTMAPYGETPEESRPVFRRLRELRDELRDADLVDASFTELSMGMTNDYAVAVEEGATLVRVGRALFHGLAASE